MADTKTVRVTLETSGAWEIWTFDVPNDADEEWVRDNYSGLSGSLHESGHDHETISEVEFDDQPTA